MRVNTRIHHGLKIVVTLASHGKLINTTQLSQLMKVSPKYLRKLAGPLERSGIIQSFQGVRGGYKLRQKPEEITLQKIMTAIGEEIHLVNCLKKDCARIDECLTQPIWMLLDQILKTNLLAITVADILAKKPRPC